MAELTGKTALVTGASAGIGRAFAEELASRGFQLVITARRLERLQELQRELSARHGVRVEVIAADLAVPDAAQALFDEVARRQLAIDVLVNNAGYGLGVKYFKTSWKEQADFIQVMVTAVAQLTYLFVPQMAERGWGRIINVASLAGLLPGGPGSTLYAAAKSFMIKFTESLALEMTNTGVKATAVCPGFTLSEFHDVNATRPRVEKMPKLMWLDAHTVASQGIDAAMAGRVVVVTGALNKLIATTMKHIPDALARRVLLRQSKNFRHVD
jgi:short-subunit dehydrogenase